MKRITTFILIVATGLIVNAQQLPQFTQYMINDYVFNPAIAGIESNYQMIAMDNEAAFTMSGGITFGRILSLLNWRCDDYFD